MRALACKTWLSAGFGVVLCGVLGGCGESGKKDSATTGPSSGFEHDDDGWTVAGDAQSSSVKPDFFGTGGNPDGLISAKDDATGGVWYFVAPAKYHGAHAAAFGKKLTFDLKTDQIVSPFSAYDVMLAGGGVTLVTAMPEDPLPVGAWKSYRLPLGEGASWQVATDETVGPESDLTALPAATDAQIQTVLGNVTLFKIRGEYNTGADTGALDNVHFGAD